MSSMPDRLVISNTSPLLYLYQVGHLEESGGLSEEKSVT
jgi:hypothetical protein